LETDSRERATARYVALHEQGMEAIESWARESWRQRVHAGSVRPTDPDPVSEQLAYAYRGISYARGKLTAAEQALDSMGMSGMPLFRKRD
jgi:hypothetical protein